MPILGSYYLFNVTTSSKNEPMCIKLNFYKKKVPYNDTDDKYAADIRCSVTAGVDTGRRNLTVPTTQQEFFMTI